MYSIRKAEGCDWEAIDSILQEMDLSHGSVSIDNFWVGEEGGEIVAVAQTERAGDAYVLSSVGVKPERRGNGIASRLMAEILDHASGDLYLYTLIPDFFRRFGFVEALPPQPVEDYRNNYDCDACRTNACVCMVRHRDVS